MTSESRVVAPDLAKVIRTNTIVLALCMALSWAVIQLVAAVSAVSLSQLLGQTSLGGVAPGIFSASWAVASLWMGRFMDTRGRTVGLRLGFVVGVIGAIVLYLGTSLASVPAFLVGLVLVGMCAGSINLARAGAADMYPPERRARGISFVLLGAAAGAVISPIAFSPLLTGVRNVSGLATPWLVAGVLLACGAAITFGMRVDPVQIARKVQAGASEATPERRSLRELLDMPSVAPAMFAAVVAQAVMAGMMTIIGLVMVERGQDLGAVALTMSVHFIGMFGLVLVVGHLVDWFGRLRSIIVGLLILAGGTVTLAAGSGLQAVLPGMFAIGVGWNIAFVGSTAVMADAANPAERAGLLGFNDFVATSMVALTAVAAGLIFGLVGLTPLVALAAILSLSPIVFLRPFGALLANDRPADSHPTAPHC